MLDRRSVDRGGEAKGLLEITVRDLHLLIRRARRTASVLSAARDVEHIALYVDLYLLSRYTCELDLDHPALGRLVNIGSRIPQLSGAHVLRGADELEQTIGRFRHYLPN